LKAILNITYGVLIGLIAAGIIWLAMAPARGEEIVLLPTATPGLLTVYVSGAVATPGVYALPEGSRVEAAVNAAGGLLPGADANNINLAMLIEDGQQIVVPGITNTGRVNAGRVNINTASLTDLETLPGIGPTTAQAILDYRLQHGSFEVIQQIQNVSGIGPATFSAIQNYISVGP
jgi:competence protein ComEA